MGIGIEVMNRSYPQLQDYAIWKRDRIVTTTQRASCGEKQPHNDNDERRHITTTDVCNVMGEHHNYKHLLPWWVSKRVRKTKDVTPTQ